MNKKQASAKKKAILAKRAAKKKAAEPPKRERSVHVGLHKKRTRKRMHAFQKHNRHIAYLKGRAAFYAWDTSRIPPVNPFRAIVLRGDWTTGFCDAQTYYEGKDKVRDNKKVYNVANLEREFLDSISDQEEHEPRAAVAARVEEVMQELLVEKLTNEILAENAENEMMETA